MAETERSQSPVSVREPNFQVDDEFRDASYIDRTEQLCLRMVRQRLVDAATFLTSDKQAGVEGKYNEPNQELAFERFLTSLVSHVRTYVEYEHSETDENDGQTN